MPDLAGRTTLFRYANGITHSESMGESWGSTTVTIPLISFNDGVLIADKLYGLNKTIEEARKGERDVDREPSVLEQIDQDFLLFTDEFSRVEIRRVGNVVVITSEGGC